MAQQPQQQQRGGGAISEAQRVVRAALSDPGSAQFRNVRQMPNGAVCGQVNAKNRMGGFVGFSPFAVDRSLNVMHIHSSRNHANDDHNDIEFNVRAVCERQPQESLRDIRQRIADDIISSAETNRVNWCGSNPSSLQCQPNGISFARQLTRSNVMIYVRYRKHIEEHSASIIQLDVDRIY